MRFSTLLLYLLFPFVAFPQAGEWTWVKGDSALNSMGNFGLQGVPSPLNEPSARYACGQWTDTAGNFWIYSGVQAPDDLWKFDSKTLQWTWMLGDSSGFAPINVHTAVKGVYDPKNSPGMLDYGILTWTTPDNHLWLFGGLITYPAFHMNDDLWQYNPSINQWAWMGTSGPAHYETKGTGNSTTMPGGRQEGNCAFTDDNGNLWLFGGCDANYKSYNDVWKYDVSTGIWTWMSGSSIPEDPGIYGAIGVPSVNNYPASRSTNLFWKDNYGNFWISGGTNYTQNIMYQDAWKFNPITLDWTWVNGIQGEDTSAYGGNCIFDNLNKIGPRYENRANWKNCEDLIITYNGFNDWKTSQPTNDMWGFKISTNRWIKINSWDSTGHYGTMGVSSSLNQPPSRFGGVGFTGKDNGLWLFGGQNLTGSGVFFNDLWKYVIDTNCVPCKHRCSLAPPLISADKNIICSSDSAQICASSGFVSYEWNAGGSGRCIEAKQAGNYYVGVSDANKCTAESNHISISVYPTTGPYFIRQGDTLFADNEAAYQWYKDGFPINNATSSVYVVHEPGSYSLVVTDFNGCVHHSAPIIFTGINDIEEESVMIYPNPFSMNNVQLSITNGLIGSKLEVFDDNGRLVFNSKLETQNSKLRLDVSRGVYLLRISSPKANIIRKLIKL